MTRFSRFMSCRLVVVVLLSAAGVVYSQMYRKDVGQAEVIRLSPALTSSSRQQEPVRLVGVVEPGRILNIFLGVVLVVGIAVLNSIIFMALGVTGSLPPRFERTTRNRPTTTSDVPSEWAARVFDAISRR